MIPRASACADAAACRARASGRAAAPSAASPTQRAASASLMLMSCPLVGLGRRREDRLPAGGPIPAARPAARCRTPSRSPGTPSSRTPTGSRAPRTRSSIGLRLPDQHRPAAQQIGVGLRGGGEAARRPAQEVVRDDVRQLVEPERRQLGQHLALVRDAGAQHVVEGGDAVGGDQEQRVVRGRNVADFPGAKPGDRREIGLDNRSGGRHERLLGETLHVSRCREAVGYS